VRSPANDSGLDIEREVTSSLAFHREHHVAGDGESSARFATASSPWPVRLMRVDLKDEVGKFSASKKIGAAENTLAQAEFRRGCLRVPNKTSAASREDRSSAGEADLTPTPPPGTLAGNLGTSPGLVR